MQISGLWIDDNIDQAREDAAELQLLIDCRWEFALDFPTAVMKLNSKKFDVLITDNSFQFGASGLKALGLEESHHAGEAFIEALVASHFEGSANALKLIILYSGDRPRQPGRLLSLDSRVRSVQKPGGADLLSILERIT